MPGESGSQSSSSAGRTLDLELRRRHDDDHAERRCWGLALLVASLFHVAALAVAVPIAATSDELASLGRRRPIAHRLQSVRFELPTRQRYWKDRTIADVVPKAQGTPEDQGPTGSHVPAQATGPLPDGPDVSGFHPRSRGEFASVARAGVDVPVPELLWRVDPVYPALDECHLCWTGTVNVELVIGVEGEVVYATVVDGMPSSLTELALDAVRQWHFAPSAIDGEPVAVRYVIWIQWRF